MQLPFPHFVPLTEAPAVLQTAHVGAVPFSANQIVFKSQTHSLLGGVFSLSAATVPTMSPQAPQILLAK